MRIRAERKNNNTGVRSYLAGKLEGHYTLIWGLATLIAVLIFLAAGIYTKRYLNREFIGEETRFLQRCRQNPKNNGRRCEELLAARGEVKKSRYSDSMRSPQRPPFLLSDADADLTPTP